MTAPPPHSGFPPPPPDAYPAGYYGYPQHRPTNGLAIASLVCAFLFAPLGIVFGHISLSQIKRTGEEGRGLAIAGLIISYLLTVLAILVLVLSAVFIVVFARNMNTALDGSDPDYPDITVDPSAPGNQLPAFKPPETLGANCQYPATTAPASKPATPPRTGRVPTDPAVMSASVTTNRGDIGLKLDNGKAPCTVNNFASLAQQGYFDNTTCHRLTTAPNLGVLQCGDPSGSGQGGPGYRFPNEYPTNQYRMADPALLDAGGVSARDAGDGQRRARHQRQPVFLVYGGFSRAAADVHRVRHHRQRPGWRRWTRSPPRVWPAGSDDGKPVFDVTIESARLD